MPYKPRDFDDIVTGRLIKRLNTISEQTAEHARSTVPVRTGRLQRSIKVIPARMIGDKIEGGIEAGEGVNYAGLIEFTRVPFMGGAVPVAESGLTKLKGPIADEE